MSDKELKLRCFEIALQHTKAGMGNFSQHFDEFSKNAEMIYRFISSEDK